MAQATLVSVGVAMYGLLICGHPIDVQLAVCPQQHCHATVTMALWEISLKWDAPPVPRTPFSMKNGVRIWK